MGVKVPDVLGALRAEDLTSLVGADEVDAVATYARRERTWEDIAADGFTRLERLEAEVVDLRERLAWCETVLETADALVSSVVEQVCAVVGQLRADLRS